MVVESAAELAEFDEAGKFSIPGGRDFPAVFAEFGGHPSESKGAVKVGFLVHLRQVTVAGKVVFVEGKALFAGKGAEFDVMLLAAGKILEGKGKVCIADRTEVALQAVFKPNRSFGVAVGDDFVDLGKGGEKGSDPGGVGGGDEEVEIVEGFLGTSVGSGDFGAVHRRMVAQSFEEGLGEGGHLPEPEAVGELLVVFDGSEDFLHGFGSEAGELGDFLALAGFLELRD